jgi:hypothetical protein
MDSVHWVELTVEIKCTACSQTSPINHLDLDGMFYCVSCGREMPFDEDLWGEDVLFVASATGDQFWTKLRAFPPWPTGKPSEDDDSEDWCEKWQAIQPVFAELGTTKARVRITSGGMVIAAGVMKARSVTAEAFPGHPLCPSCHVPLHVSFPSRGQVVAQCSRCGTTSSYRVPEAAFEQCQELVGVIAPDHSEGRPPVRLEAQPGTAAIAIRCGNCSAALSLTPGEHFVTCQYCKTTSVVPNRVMAQAQRGAKPEPWWVAFRAPSAMRQRLAESVAKGGASSRGDEDDGDDHTDRSENVRPPAGKSSGALIATVAGSVVTAAGVGVAVFALHGARPAPAPPQTKAAASSTAATAPTAANPRASATLIPSCACTLAADKRAKTPALDVKLATFAESVQITPAGTTRTFQHFLDVGGKPALSLPRAEGAAPPSSIRGDRLRMALACDGDVAAFVSGSVATGWSIPGQKLAWTAALPAAMPEPSVAVPAGAGADVGCTVLPVRGGVIALALEGNRRVTLNVKTGKLR